MIPHRIELVFVPATTPLPIEANIAQVRQVLMNLAINAAEAINGSGVVTITTGLRELCAHELSSMQIGADQPPGQYAALTVQDTGQGMDETTKARIFDPFFSTKFTGRGLGLATVNGIVRAHRGALELVTAPGQGTTFTVYWPLVTSSPTQEEMSPPSQSAPVQTTSTNVGVNSTVLVVDDEPAVRHVAQRMLHRLGFTVYEAGSSDEALFMMRQYGEQITLTLIDLTMPGMTGDELADTLLAQYPTLRIILTSGFSQQEVPAHLRATGKVSFLAKPFTMNTLSQAINIALSSHAL